MSASAEVPWRAFCMNWSKLNHLQLGKYGEYLAKMECVKHGLDVYTAEVDDKGIDFIVRNEKDGFFEIQVKSVRNNSYVFMRKEVFTPKHNFYLALLIFETGENPIFFLIPSMDWAKNKHSFLVERKYEGKKSKPEFGINISAKSIAAMHSYYEFSKVIGDFNGVEQTVVSQPVEDL